MGKDAAELFVVVDTMGAGRIVGVFDTLTAAERVVGGFAAYYKIERCQPNRIDPVALKWTSSPEQRAHLELLLEIDSKR